MLKEYFETYLRINRKVSDGTVRHYNTAINTINGILNRSGFYNHTLFEVDSIELLESIKKYIYGNEEFLKKDEVGNRMYSVAFNHFYKFACEGAIHSKEEIEKLDIVIPKPQMVKYSANSGWKRNQIIVSQVIYSSDFSCEFDNKHKTFTSVKTGKNYVEGHHIVPLRYQESFDNSLDVYANIVSLCPICHRLLHHGIFDEKIFVLKKLFGEREYRLKNSGIDIKINEFLQIVE